MFTSPITGQNFSSNCGPNGNGQCDGHECACACHSDWTADLPETVEGMKVWHEDYWQTTFTRFTA